MAKFDKIAVLNKIGSTGMVPYHIDSVASLFCYIFLFQSFESEPSLVVSQNE